MKNLVAVLVLMTAGLSSKPQTAKWKANLPDDVSILQLIANPEHYDGKRIRVVGFLSVQFEADILYLHFEDFQHRIYKNGIWVYRNPQTVDDMKRLNETYVMIVGTFKAGDKGHGALESGALADVSEILDWPALSNRKSKR